VKNPGLPTQKRLRICFLWRWRPSLEVHQS